MNPAEVKKWRRDFLVQGTCCKCGGSAHDLHEIIAGPHRQKAMGVRACVLRVCRMCHLRLQGADIEYQLAYKLLSDPEGFCIRTFCNTWGRPSTAVDPAMILTYLKCILVDRE